jgi:hypothetical protein
MKNGMILGRDDEDEEILLPPALPAVENGKA